MKPSSYGYRDITMNDVIHDNWFRTGTAVDPAAMSRIGKISHDIITADNWIRIF